MALSLGPYAWSLQRNEEGQREYSISFKVQGLVTDSPFDILYASGLPLVGDPWTYGNLNDPWAFCTPYANITTLDSKDEKTPYYKVDLKFSTRSRQRCQDTPIEDPLLEPDRWSFSNSNAVKEFTHDRYGNLLSTSSFEPLRGPQVEFDIGTPRVSIEQNRLDLELPLLASLVNCLNDSPLWGLAPRTIRFSNYSAERKIYGSCSYYYTRSLEFEINYATWDKTAVDEGNKALNGKFDANGDWVLINIGGSPPDRHNPRHFKRVTDAKGNPMRVLLNGQGEPLDVASGTGIDEDEVSIPVEVYQEANLLSLGIPLILGV